MVKGDYTLLQVVFENLISNAIKFTSKKDFAIIEIDQCNYENEHYTIYIKDNGAGFDMLYANKLFSVFQRLHTENEFEGTGIGLANVKQIIQKHGGSIKAEAEINKGATFYITI
ncbi:MAG: ATP-binding protein [Candidatus Sericytochromatia bacterium]